MGNSERSVFKPILHLCFARLSLFLSLFIIVLSSVASAQQVTIKVNAPPPLTLRIEDLCSATIAAQKDMSVYVKGTATEASKGLMAKATTEKFKIHAGVNRYTTANLPPIADKWVEPKFEKSINQTGTLPEGKYEIFIQLFDEKGSLLDDDKLTQLVQMPQIRLISPKKWAKITESNPLFQWSNTRPIKGVEYELKVYEIMPGQNEKDATNNVPYFEEKGIKTASFKYPISAKAFEQGKTYCWQVKAFSGGYSTTMGEIRVFGFRSIVKDTYIREIWSKMELIKKGGSK